jgi:hypothetical protein
MMRALSLASSASHPEPGPGQNGRVELGSARDGLPTSAADYQRQLDEEGGPDDQTDSQQDGFQPRRGSDTAGRR